MTAQDENPTFCPGGCGCQLGTDDADARECDCEDGCCDGQDWFEVGDADAGTILVAWTEGERCRIVEHDETTGEPKPDGRVLTATVDYQDGHGFVFADIPGLGRAIAFRADTGRAFGSNSGWRLMPETDEAATAAGTDAE